MDEHQAAYRIIETCIELHKRIGPGLLASSYRKALAFDLSQKGLAVEQRVPMPFVYKKVHQKIGYYLDLVVAEKVIVQIKTVEKITPTHLAQMTTFLKLSKLPLAILINFNCKNLQGNIYRFKQHQNHVTDPRLFCDVAESDPEKQSLT